MARLLSAASTAFTTATTWGTIDSTSYSNSEAATSGLTTSPVASTAFTPGIITIDGIAVKIATRAVTPLGTMTVDLFNSTAAAQVAGTAVTINVSDVPVTGETWMFFKFAAPVTILGATNYAVRASTSDAAQISLYASATTNWSRLLRTTTTAAPAAADDLFVMGEWTAAATVTAITVSMDNTASTTFGLLEIGSNGNLNYATSASTNYLLKLAGECKIYGAGILAIGTSGTRMPATSTGYLDMICGSNVQYGVTIRAMGTLRMYGPTMSVVYEYLAANSAIGATTLTSTTSTGWLSGDDIAITDGKRAAFASLQYEVKALTGNAAGTSLPITATTFAHVGVGDFKEHIVNLTRRVGIRGVSTSLQTYVDIQPNGIIDAEYAIIRYLGSGTANKRGIDNRSNVVGNKLKYCVFRDAAVVSSFGIVNATTGGNLDASYCVYYNCYFGLAAQTTTGGGSNFSYSIAIAGGTGGYQFSLGDESDNYDYMVAANGNGTSGAFSIIIPSQMTMTGLNAYSQAVSGPSISNCPNVTFNSFRSVRNNGVGVVINGLYSCTISGFTIVGNATCGIRTSGQGITNTMMYDFNINGDATYAQPIGIQQLGGPFSGLMGNSNIGGTVAHTTSDLQVASTLVSFAFVFRNTIFGSATEIQSQSLMNLLDYVASARHDQTDGLHKVWKRTGTLTSDSTIFGIGVPSQRMTPTSASLKLQGSSKLVAVSDGSTVTVSVRVRTSVLGDGTAYNGSLPRLIARRNTASGISSDTVLATTTVASSGAFETIIGTTVASIDNAAFEFFVDCDGTTGWVNVDDWSVL